MGRQKEFLVVFLLQKISLPFSLQRALVRVVLILLLTLHRSSRSPFLIPFFWLFHWLIILFHFSILLFACCFSTLASSDSSPSILLKLLPLISSPLWVHSRCRLIPVLLVVPPLPSFVLLLMWVLFIYHTIHLTSISLIFLSCPFFYNLSLLLPPEILSSYKNFIP